LHENDIERLDYFAKKACYVLVAPTSDLFHKDIPEDFIVEVFKAIDRNLHRGSIFRILTKRSERMMELTRKYDFDALNYRNVVVGVTVDSPDYYYRIEHLRKAKGLHKGVGISPLLCRFPDLPVKGLTEVAICDELGDNPRPFNSEWMREIQAQCQEAGVYCRDYRNQCFPFWQHWHLSLIFQLIEPTNGVMAVPGWSHPKAQEFAMLYQQLKDLPIPELQALVREKTPEFFEGGKDIQSGNHAGQQGAFRGSREKTGGNIFSPAFFN